MASMVFISRKQRIQFAYRYYSASFWIYGSLLVSDVRTQGWVKGTVR